MTDTMITLPEAEVIELQDECEALKSRERRLRHTLELWRQSKQRHKDSGSASGWDVLYTVLITDIEDIFGSEPEEEDRAEAEAALSDEVDGLPCDEANAIRYGAMLKGA